MADRRHPADLVVVGGGPAGAAAAIAGAQRGLRVIVLERDRPGAERPGETLHPGIEPLLAQLGLAGRLAGVTGARHAGAWVEWGGPRRFEPFGADASGQWHGFQVRRAALDALLLSRARDLGAEVRQPRAAVAPLVEDGVVRGVRTARGRIDGRVVIDASGRARWLARALDVPSERRSRRLLARYGYARGDQPGRDEAPLLAGDAAGWTWTARVGPGLYHWTRVPLGGPRPAPGWRPAEFAALAPHGRARGADVTWRLTERAAGPGWFLAGEAAATLDPTSGRGVLKAILSGVMAAHLAHGVLTAGAPPDRAAAAYHAWLAGWFERDARQLAEFYRQLGAEIA